MGDMGRGINQGDPAMRMSSTDFLLAEFGRLVGPVPRALFSDLGFSLYFPCFGAASALRAPEPVAKRRALVATRGPRERLPPEIVDKLTEPA